MTNKKTNESRRQRWNKFKAKNDKLIFASIVAGTTSGAVAFGFTSPLWIAAYALANTAGAAAVVDHVVSRKEQANIKDGQGNQTKIAKNEADALVNADASIKDAELEIKRANKKMNDINNAPKKNILSPVFNKYKVWRLTSEIEFQQEVIEQKKQFKKDVLGK